MLKSGSLKNQGKLLKGEVYLLPLSQCAVTSNMDVLMLWHIFPQHAVYMLVAIIMDVSCQRANLGS